jgi:MOSC domain-containing protein
VSAAVVATGTVVSLNRWPVKSFAGEAAADLRLDGRGVAGDRTHAIVDHSRGTPRLLTAREAPRLLGWRAAYAGLPGDAVGPEAPPLPHLVDPAGRAWRWDDPELTGALADDLGRPVSLSRDLAGQQDLERSVLVTCDATHRALESELGEPVDVRRFRTNVHLALDAPAWAEHDWTGLELRIGEARLELLHPCERCVIPTRDPDTWKKWPDLLRRLARDHDTLFGINARPLHAARIAVGDPVVVTARTG